MGNPLLKRYFADLHIHIGSTKSGRPVKITAAKNLTLTNILQCAKNEKGLDIVGVIDCHSPEVLEEIEDLLSAGRLTETADGTLSYDGQVSLFPGSEVEINDPSALGPVHVLCFLPDLPRMREFSRWLSCRMKNIHLSSQRIHAGGRELQKQVKRMGGLFIPAHIFTPFKGLFGIGVKRRLDELFDPELIDAVELGLSSDTAMANRLRQLHRYPFLSNSDSHSLQKIAREYQAFRLEEPSFTEFRKALLGNSGRAILANYGLDPLLGKYYRTTCAHCRMPVDDGTERCPSCGSTEKIKGVAERIRELTDAERGPDRPPYVHQIPLEFIPGIGPKTLKKLLKRFGTEMSILHEASDAELEEVLPKVLAERILLAREGQLRVEAGGGGRYGKLSFDG